MDIRRGKTSSIKNCTASTFSVYSGFALGLKNLEKLQNCWKIRKKIVIYNKILEKRVKIDPRFWTSCLWAGTMQFLLNCYNRLDKEVLLRSIAEKISFLFKESPFSL